MPGRSSPSSATRNGNQASLDTYRLFQKHMKPDYKPVPPSLYSEGIGIARTGGDRGDAAMYAYGCARFCLARGDKAHRQRTLARHRLVSGILPPPDHRRRRDRLRHR